MKVFIPISDEELERWPADESLVPYRTGVTLLSQLAEPPADGDDAFTRCEAAVRPRDEPPVRLPYRN